MNISMRYFLTVAEELSVSRAAQKLYVSQQCVSSHIKKLEQTYQAEFFTRRPYFRLTPEGEAFRRNLLRQSVLENALTEELDDLKRKRHNKVRVGIHNTRAGLLLPGVIHEFQKKFDDALIEIHQGDTLLFEQMLLDGDLDLFLATDTVGREEFRCVFLQKEAVFLFATPSLLRKYGLEDVVQTHIIDPHQLSTLPVICSPPDSYLQKKVDQQLEQKGIRIEPKIVVGTYRIKLMLAAQDSGVCFCPQMSLQILNDINQTAPPDNHLIPVKASGLDLTTEISIITHRESYQSSCLRCFSELFERAIIKALQVEPI